MTGSCQDLAAAQRAPRLGADAELFVLFPQFGLLEPGVQFDLVDGGHHLGGLAAAGPGGPAGSCETPMARTLPSRYSVSRAR